MCIRDSYQARVYGVPIVGAGRIYPHSFEKIVLNEEGLLINNDWKHLIGVDFGWTDNDPSAMVLIALDETNDVIYVLDEWKGKTPDDAAFAKEVNYLDPRLPVAWPRDGSKSSDWKGGGTIADKLRTDFKLNLLVDPFMNPPSPDGSKNNHLDPGFQEINSRFASNRLKISSKCAGLLSEIEGYGYGKDNNGQPTGKPAKYQQDHLCDAFRYAVMTIIQGYGASRWREAHVWEKYQEDEFVYNAY